jgi:hypothetical protein
MARSEAGVHHQLVVASTAAVSGDFAAFPLDTLKVRMQMCPKKSSAPEMIQILRAEGIRAIYKVRGARGQSRSDKPKPRRPAISQGVTASAFRQFTYGGLRLSLYEPFRNEACKLFGESKPSLRSQVCVA